MKKFIVAATLLAGTLTSQSFATSIVMPEAISVEFNSQGFGFTEGLTFRALREVRKLAADALQSGKLDAYKEIGFDRGRDRDNDKTICLKFDSREQMEYLTRISALNSRLVKVRPLQFFDKCGERDSRWDRRDDDRRDDRRDDDRRGDRDDRRNDDRRGL